MKSRVHPKYKTKYRVRNWASYVRALVRRGDITVWLSLSTKPPMIEVRRSNYHRQGTVENAFFRYIAPGQAWRKGMMRI